ncbi:MAG: hypothetical protein K2M17_06125 [Bacilli bacterium]|nr:hypothetical protein [Bacilli bacterium]
MDRKNAIVLTVIATATLLVAMIGATFAYFTAQTGTGKSVPVNVTTSTSDSLNFGGLDPMTIVATQQNFGKDAGSHQATTSGKVTLKANNDTAADYCYTVDLVAQANGLKYAEGADAPAELVFSISKDDVAVTSIPGLTQITPLTDHLICKNPQAETPCTNTETTTVSGFDITTIANQTIHIPGTETVGTASIFKIHAEPGATVEHEWKAAVTLVNLDSDQNYNTNTAFAANLKFETVNCTTGEPVGTPTTPETP